MNRPSGEIPKAWKEYVEWLERILKDPRAKLYQSIMKKIDEIADKMDGVEVTFDDKDDKSFDRVMKTIAESRDIFDNTKFLRNEIGIEKTETANTGRNTNPMEQTAK